MIYLQAILYLIKVYWKLALTVVLVLTTLILGILWCFTRMQIYYYIGCATGIAGVILMCFVAESALSKHIGLWMKPEDEDV